MTEHNQPDLAVIAGRLTGAQSQYLNAVQAAETPYAPRHGRTANWALRHGYVETVMRGSGGRIGCWDDFDRTERLEMLGQVMTPLGLALRDHIKGVAGDG